MIEALLWLSVSLGSFYACNPTPDELTHVVICMFGLGLAGTGILAFAFTPRPQWLLLPVASLWVDSPLTLLNDGLLGYLWLAGVLKAFHLLDHALFATTVPVRRFLVARLGLRRLQRWVACEVIDTDAGARLLKWDFARDEAVVGVEVRCPSTGEVYVLRVPPNVRTCNQALAWTFNVPSYGPLKET